MDDQHKKQ
jgi:dsRNA-specific ribonuclease